MLEMEIESFVARMETPFAKEACAVAREQRSAIKLRAFIVMMDVNLSSPKGLRRYQRPKRSLIERPSMTGSHGTGGPVGCTQEKLMSFMFDRYVVGTVLVLEQRKCNQFRSSQSKTESVIILPLIATIAGSGR